MLLTILASLLLTATGTADASAPPNMQQMIYGARDRVLPALVHIQPVIKNYFTGELEKQAVVGSGVIFHEDGYVVTNYHVAGKAERILCTLHDKELVAAKYVGGDPLTDLAVIQLDLESYGKVVPVAAFGNSDSLQVGEYVLAMGSPLALSRSVSAGVVSTKDRYFSPDVRLPSGERTGRYNLWIQTDAAINPGNSGGPLVDMRGRVVGINSRATLFANNLGFAIPINVARQVTSAILAKGSVERSWIGLHCQAMQEMEEYFGTSRDEGVLVSSVDPGSPAEAAFMRAGDVILKVNGSKVSARSVEELPSFYNLIALHEPGSQVRLRVLRDEQEFDLEVTARALGDLQGEDFECQEWGFTVKGITSQMQIERQFDDSTGILVVGVKQAGPADEGGLSGGDVITSVNEQSIIGLADFVLLYEELVANQMNRILATVSRGGSVRYVLLKIDKSSEGDSNE